MAKKGLAQKYILNVSSHSSGAGFQFSDHNFSTLLRSIPRKKYISSYGRKKTSWTCLGSLSFFRIYIWSSSFENRSISPRIFQSYLHSVERIKLLTKWRKCKTFDRQQYACLELFDLNGSYLQKYMMIDDFYTIYWLSYVFLLSFFVVFCVLLLFGKNCWNHIHFSCFTLSFGKGLSNQNREG